MERNLPFNTLGSFVSSVANIIAFLESSVELSSPALAKSKHYYDFSKNPTTRDKHIYAIRPGAASVVDGTLKSITVRQDFFLEISRDFFLSEADDNKLRETIDAIYADNEKIQKEISFRRLDEILKINPPSFDAPIMNENGRSVSIIFTYEIFYRKGVK